MRKRHNFFKSTFFNLTAFYMLAFGGGNFARFENLNLTMAIGLVAFAMVTMAVVFTAARIISANK